MLGTPSRASCVTGQLMVIDSRFSTAADAASAALNVGVDVPAVVGVPIMVPSGFTVRPFGNAIDPAARLHLYVPGPVPPDATNAALYVWPTIPAGSGKVMSLVSIVSALCTVRVKDFVTATPLLSCTR